MKRVFLLFILFISFETFLKPQTNTGSCIPLIGETAPRFTAESTMGTINFPDDYSKQWKILFSHPSDFTPVCSSELLELANLQDEFDKMNTRLLVVSTDGLDSHLEWTRSLESIKYKNTMTPRIRFPLIADKSLEISKLYGMIHPNSSTTKDVRGVFIIDPENKIRAIFFYPFDVGRNIDEIKRTLTALQTNAKFNVLTPANWQPGDDVLIHSPKTMAESEKMTDRKDPDLYSVIWYMWFRKMK
jgi:peroxiredoxin (alkyl hydroperoxide reductase subunit C)